MLKGKKNEKRIFGFGQSLVLSRLKRDLSKTKRREKLSLFSAVTLSHFHFHRANNETTTTSPPGGTFPFFCCARRLSYTEKRKEKDRIKLEKFKNVRLLLVGKPQQQTLFDTTRSSRICCISRSSKRSRAMHRQRYVRNAPCSTSSSPWSRLGRIGSGQNRCFVTSTPPRRRARSPSLATRTRWRCTQSSHR